VGLVGRTTRLDPSLITCLFVLLAWLAPAVGADAPDFILLSMSGGLVGGQTEQSRVFYVERTGTVQSWTETSDDRLLELHTGAAEPNRLFETAERAFQVPAESPPAPPPGPEKALELPEYFPPRVLLQVRLNGREASWIGAKDTAPAAWRELLGQLLAWRDGDATLKRAAPGRYLRAELLSANVVEFMREAKLIQDLSPDELATRPWIQEAIARPHALRALGTQDNPFAGLRQPKGDPARAHIAVNAQCYLLRLLTYNPTPGQAPGKETSK